MNKLVVKQKAIMPWWVWLLDACAVFFTFVVMMMEINSSYYFYEPDPTGYIVCLIIEIVAIIFSWVMYSNLYVAIYDDHVEGKGPSSKYNMWTNKAFNFPAGQYSISKEGGNVVIVSNDQKRYIPMTADAANRFIAQAANPAAYQYTQPQPTVTAQPQYQPPQQPTQAQQPVSQPTTNEAPAANINASQQYVKFYCPSCGTHIQVPAGLGHIKATCPNCKNQIDRTT